MFNYEAVYILRHITCNLGVPVNVADFYIFLIFGICPTKEICQNQSCNANAGGGMKVHPETIDSHGVNVNIEQRGCVLHEQMENQNTGHPSPNSSTKSFDVDLTKIIPPKEYDHIHRSKTVSHENFKVPACPPCKIMTTSKKPFKPAEHCISDVETEPGFSDIQSEFDWNLLSGAAYERGNFVVGFQFITSLCLVLMHYLQTRCFVKVLLSKELYNTCTGSFMNNNVAHVPIG